MENIKVNSVSEAWRTAERIFPTDYEKNEESSKRAGYPIYETNAAYIPRHKAKIIPDIGSVE